MCEVLRYPEVVIMRGDRLPTSSKANEDVATHTESSLSE